MVPSNIILHKKSKTLELQYEDGDNYQITAEMLRVLSPSAEVRGHHPSQAVLQFGKKDINIQSISASGNYAIQITFDDGHDSGIYSWTYLRELAENAENYWNDYLQQLQNAGKSRDPDVQVVQLIDPNS